MTVRAKDLTPVSGRRVPSPALARLALARAPRPLASTFSAVRAMIGRYPSRHVRPVALAILAPLAVAGCARYHAEPISAATTAAALDARALDDPRLQKFIATGLPPDGKQDGTAAWDLAKLTLAALYYHPDLDVARAKLASARAGVITAGQRPNPSLSFEDLSYAAAATPSPWTIAPVINFVIETFDKREYRTAQAENLTEAARHDLATAAWEVRGRVRTALLGLWAAQRRLVLTKHRLAIQEQLVTLLEHRFAAGQASALDVTRERNVRNQIRLDVRGAERQEIDGRAQLATAIGIPIRALDGIGLSFDAFDRPAPAGSELATADLRRQALLGRSDVQGLLAEYAAAQSALQLEVARQFPNLTLSPGYSYNASASAYLLLPAAELPVFNQNQGPIAEAEARRKDVAARFTALQAQIIGAVDAAAANYRALLQSLATADALLAGEQSREHQVSRSFQAGEADRPTLVAVELELAAVRLSRLDAAVQERQALGALEDALQHPLFEPAIPLFAPETSPRIAAEPSS